MTALLPVKIVRRDVIKDAKIDERRDVIKDVKIDKKFDVIKDVKIDERLVESTKPIEESSRLRP
jgi:hypothetical protein